MKTQQEIERAIARISAYQKITDGVRRMVFRSTQCALDWAIDAGNDNDAAFRRLIDISDLPPEEVAALALLEDQS